MALVLLCTLTACPIPGGPSTENIDPEEGHNNADDAEPAFLFPFYVGAVWQYRVSAESNGDTGTPGTIQLTVVDVDTAIPSATISVTGQLSEYPGGYTFSDTIFIRQNGDDELECRSTSSEPWAKTLATGSWSDGAYLLVPKNSSSTMETSSASVTIDLGTFDTIKVRSYKSDYDSIYEIDERETSEQYFCDIGIAKSYHYRFYGDYSGYPFISATKQCEIVLTGYEIPLPDGTVVSNGGVLGPDVAPLAPTNLEATVTQYTEVHLSWDDTSPFESGFVVERSVGGGSFLEIDRTEADVATYDTSELRTTASVIYTYRVAAFNDAGLSAYSNSVDVLILALTRAADR